MMRTIPKNAGPMLDAMIVANRVAPVNVPGGLGSSLVGEEELDLDVDVKVLLGP